MKLSLGWPRRGEKEDAVQGDHTEERFGAARMYDGAQESNAAGGDAGPRPHSDVGAGDEDDDALDEVNVPFTGGTETLRAAARGALRDIFDPEIPVNIFDLGLIYGVHFLAGGVVKVLMTLTSPSCPAAIILPGEVEEKMAELEGVSGAEVEVVWEPTWTPERMSESAKLELGMF
jgi:FeS assembly SUF system protein